jgi:hypothetical protein
MEEQQTTIFRHNFSEDIMKCLYDFSKIHQYDARSDYKEAWGVWIEIHKDMVSLEERRLKENGFEGDVYDKMYKSARYYFRKKKDFGERKKEQSTRKKYVALDHMFLEKMDTHMLRHCLGEKPALCFEMFCIMHEMDIYEEEDRVCHDYGIIKEDFMKKIKKTYKNRYFQNISKKHNSLNIY